MSWAPCEVTGRLNASARWHTFMNAVTPPQFVTSGSGKVTPPAAMSWRNSYSVWRFSPAAIGRPPSRTMRTWPGTSSGIVGSSSHTGAQSARAPRGADRLVDAPAHVGVDHQRKVRTEMRAHRPHARHVVLAATGARPSS